MRPPITIILLGVTALVAFFVGMFIESQRVPQDPYVDLRHATPEFRQKLGDPAFQALISSVTITIPESEPASQRLLIRGEEVSFPVATLFIANDEIRWPELSSIELQSSFDAHKEGWVLVNMWATWCAPCIAELPDMDDAYSKYEALGITLITVNVDVLGKDDDEAVKRVFEERDVNNLALFRAEGDDVTKFLNAFGMSRQSSQLPANVLYAPGGVPYATFKGGSKGNETLWSSAQAVNTLSAIVRNYVSDPPS